MRYKIALTIFIFLSLAKSGYAQNDPAVSGDDQDIISQLKAEDKKQEEALKPDIESLGLDQLPEIPKENQTSIPQDSSNDPWSHLKSNSDPLKKVASDAINKSATATAPSPKIETKKPENTQPKQDPRLMGLQQKDSDKKAEENPQAENKPEETKPEEKVETSDKKDTPKVSDIIAKPVEKIKGIFGSENKGLFKNEDEENKATLEAEEAQKQAEEKKKQEELALKKAKEKERLEKRRQQQIALAEIRRKQKAAKLEALRQRYLRDAGDDVYEGIASYQAISTIVPKEKVPPKFLNSEIAPPLLKRFKGPENKHHPIIISNSEKVNFMFDAISQNRIEEFNALYAQILDPNLKNSFGDTLLTFSLLMRRYDAVISVLAKGADPDKQNNLGYTPLYIAIELNDYKLVEMLVDMGANVNYIDELGRTYLMQATRVGSVPIVDLLISKGVDVNAVDQNGVTALSIAYRYKKDIVAKYLLKFGAKSWVKKDYVIEDDTPMIYDIYQKWEPQNK